VGAKGLWQFMPETGRAYHLRIIEEKLDERMSPVKSTEAAIHYLSDLKQKLNSWDLVFASYNLGPYGVLARLRKAGDDVGFWDLVDAEYLPDETANYVPYIQAYALVLANLRKLNFGGTQKMPPDNTADLEVASSTRLTLVARVASTSLSTIQRLNPDILSELVPAVPSQRFVVQVPKDNVWQARDMLAALVAQKDEDDLCVPTSFDWGKQRFTDEMRLACGKKLAAPLPVPVPMQ
jgi:membrane-bound lytic murein transglycosylase D